MITKISHLLDPSQIPKGEDVPTEVQKVVSEEGGVEGQRKEVNVESYSKAASLGQILKTLTSQQTKMQLPILYKEKIQIAIFYHHHFDLSMIKNIRMFLM